MAGRRGFWRVFFFFFLFFFNGVSGGLVKAVARGL